MPVTVATAAKPHRKGDPAADDARFLISLAELSSAPLIADTPIRFSEAAERDYPFELAER